MCPTATAKAVCVEQHNCSMLKSGIKKIMSINICQRMCSEYTKVISLYSYNACHLNRMTYEKSETDAAKISS